MSPDQPHAAQRLCTTNGTHQVMAGSVAAVAEAVRQGADLRRYSTYDLEGSGQVEETMTLQTTWVFNQQHVGGLQTMRHPVHCGHGIQMQPSLALWIFGVTTPQRSAMVPLNGQPMPRPTGKWARVNNNPYAVDADRYVPKRYHWWACHGWELICDHDAGGNMTQGN